MAFMMSCVYFVVRVRRSFDLWVARDYCITPPFSCTLISGVPVVRLTTSDLLAVHLENENGPVCFYQCFSPSDQRFLPTPFTAFILHVKITKLSADWSISVTVSQGDAEMGQRSHSDSLSLILKTYENLKKFCWNRLLCFLDLEIFTLPPYFYIPLLTVNSPSFPLFSSLVLVWFSF